MLEIRGKYSGKLYHTAKTKADCHRWLSATYPAYIENHKNAMGRPRVKSTGNLLPEAMLIKPKGKFTEMRY